VDNKYFDIPATISPDDMCFKDKAQMYIQIECNYDQKERLRMGQIGVFIVFMGFIMTMLFKRFVSYLIESTSLEYEEWDLDTVTAADYTL